MDLKPYRVRINNTETTLLLSEEDARERGLTAKDLAADEQGDTRKAARPANKAAAAGDDKG
ncbi:hypothetical protein ACWEN6_25055 [Sphaerisporangium sp. NPDC004334]